MDEWKSTIIRLMSMDNVVRRYLGLGNGRYAW